MRPDATDDVEQQASSAAVSAAARAGVELVPIADAEDAHRAARLLSDVWGTGSDRPLVPPEMIRSLAHAGSYGALAVAGSETAGAALGFLGTDERGPLLHSYIAGVIERFRGSNVGFALKQHQRAWALAHGLTRVTWTFDPLVRRNAFFNLVKLGASAAGFHPDFYGSMGDSVNAGDMSDRILVVWALDSPPAVAASELRTEEIDLATLDCRRTFVRLSVGQGAAPRVAAGRGDIELVQVPDDIVGIRAADPDLGRRWRRALRDTLGAALAAGARVAGITRDGWYVVHR